MRKTTFGIYIFMLICIFNISCNYDIERVIKGEILTDTIWNDKGDTIIYQFNNGRMSTKLHVNLKDTIINDSGEYKLPIRIWDIESGCHRNRVFIAGRNIVWKVYNLDTKEMYEFTEFETDVRSLFGLRTNELKRTIKKWDWKITAIYK